MRQRLAWLLVVATTNALGQFSDPYGQPRFNNNVEEDAPWQEQQDISVPEFPKQENLRKFYVSAVASNEFYIDASTLAIGTDGVVRYVLVVNTSGGAKNVSFEGIHCAQRSWKIYATGQGDGTWRRSNGRRVEWKPIENKPVNRHHAALSRDLFCPGGVAVNSADEGRNALRLGKHPDAN